MKKFLVAILLFGLIVPAYSRDKVSNGDYKGKVYKEIRIDDNGVVLIDSLGNEIHVPTATEPGSGGELIPPLPHVTPEPNLPSGFYTDTLASVTRLGGSVVVDANEFVDGDVVTLGNATIRGHVNGSVTATGRIRIASTGVVEGDVTGSQVTLDQGAQVLGRVSEQHISIPLPTGEWPGVQRGNTAKPLVVGLILLLLQLAIAAAVTYIFPDATDRFRAVYHENIFKALVVGFVFELLLLPLTIVLVITIIGIPIAFVGLPLAIVAAGFLGFAAFCLFFSDYIQRKNIAQQSRFQQLLLGFVILESPWLGVFFGVAIDSQAMWIVFLIVAIILFFIVFTASLGAAILTRFGVRHFGLKIIPGSPVSAALTAVTEKATDGNVKTMDARVTMAAGHFRLLKGTENGDIATLTGNYNPSRFRYSYEFTPAGDRADFMFSTETASHNVTNLDGRENDWRLEFSPAVNLLLRTTIGAARCEIDGGGLTLARAEFEIGAADARIDFSSPNRTNLDTFKIEAGACKLQINNIGNSRFRLLEFDGGVGKFTLDFGGEFNYRAEANVKVGMGAMTVIIPHGLGVRLRADERWLSSLDFTKNKLVAVAGSGIYETENFDSALGQLILNLQVGLGSTNIEFR